jgi:MoxR-like ATPase
MDKRVSGSEFRLLASLGLQGLGHLDAPVLAALVTESPLLLVGPHGSAKSALLERLSQALQLEHRHYNASLVGFDDLVGFPVPEGDGLRYLRTPATLWDAQSVFLDEINRCRPEVQNKLFSIVHERRVQGMALPELRHRWAAMNPPPTNALADEEEEVYLGASPLDVALADRFGFVLPLPSLQDLEPDARREVIRSGLPARSDAGPTDASTPLSSALAACRERLPLCASLCGDWITAYLGALVVPLQEARLKISGRRAALLAGNIAAVHSARHVLANDAAQAPELADSALVALRYSLPQRATGKAIDAGLLLTLHRQAVQLANEGPGDLTLARILEEARPVRRVGMALAALQADATRVPRETMSLLVSDALASLETQARWILAQELLPRLSTLDCVDAATLELLAEPFLAQLEFEQRSSLRHEISRGCVAGFNALVTTLATLDAKDADQVALGNLGAALYVRNEWASDPAQLRPLQAALRAQLNVEPAHAR